jgi:hypothetical protein
MLTWPSPRDHRLGVPDTPAIRFTRGDHFGASAVHTFAMAYQFARPSVRIRPVSQPSGTFTSRLPACRSPFPPLDMTATVTGLLCWRDFHPQEWQPYYGITRNIRQLQRYLHQVGRLWRKWLARRTRSKQLTREQFQVLLTRHPLPRPMIMPCDGKGAVEKIADLRVASPTDGSGILIPHLGSRCAGGELQTCNIVHCSKPQTARLSKRPPQRARMAKK